MADIAHAARTKPFSIRRLPGFTAIAMLVFLILYIPIITLAVYSFNSGASPSDWEGFSLHWYAIAWQNQEVKDAKMADTLVTDSPASCSSSPVFRRRSRPEWRRWRRSAQPGKSRSRGRH